MSKINKSSEKQRDMYYLIAVVLFIVFGYLLISNRSQNKTQADLKQINKANCLADDCLTVQDLNYPVSQLPEDVKTALDEALNDEYKALTTYQAVVSKFGSVKPFSMIQGAEEQHVSSLKTIYQKYGLTIPNNNWIGKVSVPNTLQQACQTGVDAEISNVALYKERLLPIVKDFEDIIIVFTNLMNASQQKHLPAFEKCN